MTAEVLAIVGPTASGKSGLALEVAGDRPAGAVEIVAVDAFTVYRGMDVATAKPSPEERRRVPHHLVDLLDPTEDLTVAEFQRLAREAIDGILIRGATPLLVGGSGLYFRAVVDDLRFPPTDPDVRAVIEQRWTSDPDGAWRHLQAEDPAAAAKIDPANLRRTVRALEVIALTGEDFSAFAEAWEDFSSIYPGLHVVYLEPPTDELRSRIDRRSRAMVAGGLLDEARRLHGLDLSRTAAQAIGYREAFDVLEARAPAEDLAGRIADRTWRYARRQRSWFRRDPRCRPEDPEAVRRRLG